MIKNLSFWERELFSKNIDFAIIGAGIVGLSTAYFLKKYYPNKKIVVLERQFPGMGASTKNAGFACIGSPTEILSDVSLHGEQAAIDLIKMRYEGLKLLKTIVKPSDMDFSNKGAKELFMNLETQEKVIGALASLNQIMESATGQESVFKNIENTETISLGNRAIQCDIESQLNPALMIQSLYNKVISLGVNVVFGAEVKAIFAEEGKVVLSDDSEIKVEQLVICNNGFAKNLLELPDLKTVRNQVLMTKELTALPILGNYHVDEGYIYFRTYGNRILIGGARNLDMEMETTSAFGDNQKIINYLKDFVRNHIYQKEDLAYDMQWSGILGVGSSKEPIIQKIADRTTIAVRLGGMGVAIGAFVGNKVVQKITG